MHSIYEFNTTLHWIELVANVESPSNTCWIDNVLSSIGNFTSLIYGVDNKLGWKYLLLW